MKKIHGVLQIFIVAAILTIVSTCKKENNTSTTINNINGYAQKGPFINGSSVTIYDLQSDLSPTGKSFSTQIKDNKGAFELNGISLSSEYVNLRVDGFYFNEVTGKQSSSQITLNVISNITGKTTININILTHLEKSRVEYLIKNGKSFSEAKSQAQKEVLAIFNIEKSDILPSETLNISETGDDNGILLAISTILQGFRSESEMTELLSNISDDIRNDGKLDNGILGSKLINHAVYLDSMKIKSNLIKRYNDIGINVKVPDFGKYISNFISKTKFGITSGVIIYPDSGVYGPNLLSLSKSTFQGNDFSLAAQLPDGTSLKIRISNLDAAVGSGNAGFWYLDGSEYNWSMSDLDFTTNSRIFTAIVSNSICDLHIDGAGGNFLVEYFEMGSTRPTITRNIKIN